MEISKKQIRLEALKRRDRLSAEQRRDYSDRIMKKLTGLPCYQEADAVLTYISFRSEVDTFPLLERAFADGKKVFAPKVIGGFWSPGTAFPFCARWKRRVNRICSGF